VQLSQEENVKNLRLHLDRRLTWHKHISAKWKQLGVTLNNTYWLLGRESQLSTRNKLLIYKTTLKPVWKYGMQLWGTVSTFNKEICRYSSQCSACLSAHPNDMSEPHGATKQVIAETPAK
jgi:hypothetical protein